MGRKSRDKWDVYQNIALQRLDLNPASRLYSASILMRCPKLLFPADLACAHQHNQMIEF